MKRYKSFITVFMTVLILFSFINNNIVAYAFEHESGDNVAYRETAVNVTLQWNFYPNVGAYKYYVDDATGIPTGGGYYFWKYGDNDKFAAVAQDKIYTYVLNNGLGLTVSDERLSTLVQAYYSQFVNVESGFLYDGQGTKLGICLNDITGCVYENAPQNTDISIPSNEVNNIYNFYQFYINAIDPVTPDYITFQSYNSTTAANYIPTSNSYRNAMIAAVATMGNGLLSRFDTSNNGMFNNPAYYFDYTGCSAYAVDINQYNNLCNAYSLRENGKTIGYLDVKTSTVNAALAVNWYRNNDHQLVNPIPFTTYNFNNDGTFTTGTNNGTSNTLINNRYIACTKDAAKITVWKNAQIFTTVVNNTYAPTTFESTNYKNYNSNTQQNLNTNNSVVNNSTTTNQSIYNDASQSFNENISEENNYNIDNSIVIENTTEIIYNYYGDDSGGGGGGGGGSDDNNDDDLIWTALLKAIADFFKKIGELIATVLTGIVTIFTSILDAMAEIVTNFSGITDFLAAIFGWLPSEIVTLMTLALSMALFAAFITWFKK